MQVRVFASHPQGIVTVRFKQEEPAQACLSRMNGRFFGGNQIVAHMWDGFTSYHVSNIYNVLHVTSHMFDVVDSQYNTACWGIALWHHKA
jgi:hypothetical protein